MVYILNAKSKYHFTVIQSEHISSDKRNVLSYNNFYGNVYQILTCLDSKSNNKCSYKVIN